ncbi:hypothetical protein LWH48_09110 [Halomonas sp. G15]|uniref:Uncharacterized protein n=1 Tax=Billgrantia gudaonensis TaxID=376427 RepID=A0A1G8YYR5_9GAMM|nr:MULTISPECIES: hypothetical protein [Halomonas]MCE0732952.1 hypothetical protein [Halomonas sp. G15]MDC8802733.1 hypothetical protein [Halomonas pacifica]SDK07982.1 hypothetical protein SAMN04487954_11142 [Halomonas gudaonensis]
MTQTATPVPIATLDDLVQRARNGYLLRVASVKAARTAVLASDYVTGVNGEIFQVDAGFDIASMVFH